MRNEKLQIIKSCSGKIRERLGLLINPEIDFRIRRFIRHGNKYILEKSEGGIIDPPETFKFNPQNNYLSCPIGTFKDEYRGLAAETKKGSPYEAILIEVIVTINGLKISAGYNILLMNTLKRNKKYCAIIYVHVREMFQDCRLMTLLKDLEIKEAAKHGVDYIQTWHEMDNQHFNAAIIPSLKRGFILFHGSSTGNELYEDKGYVHLRYYFDRKKNKDVRVSFKDNKNFISPKDNLEIIDHLRKLYQFNKLQLPGKAILTIEKYEE